MQDNGVNPRDFLVGRKVVLFPTDTHPKVGVLKWLSPDGRAAMLELTGETREESGYRTGETVYVSGAFVLKVLGKAKSTENSDTIVT